MLSEGNILLATARAFSRWRMTPRFWKSCVRTTSWDSPERIDLVLASSNKNLMADGPQEPPQASTTMGTKAKPSSMQRRSKVAFKILILLDSRAGVTYGSRDVPETRGDCEVKSKRSAAAPTRQIDVYREAGVGWRRSDPILWERSPGLSNSGFRPATAAKWKTKLRRL